VLLNRNKADIRISSKTTKKNIGTSAGTITIVTKAQPC
jgi:hypothetical protein